LDMLKKRDDATEKTETEINDVVANSAAAMTGRQKYTIGAAVANPPPKKPTLGEILNVLDGVPERHGHILVIDTNHMDRLDSALIRPGRVDRILTWSKLSSKSMHAYLENYYIESIPKSAVFPDKMYTAAELQAAVVEKKSWTEFVCNPRASRRFGKN
jgi:SpoVK/Ycf46/Vps4 family AAA+-type ATPase